MLSFTLLFLQGKEGLSTNSKCISVNNISFAFKNNYIYEGFTFCVENNDISFIMGNNGCGKTTLLKIICSFLEPQYGDVFIMGKNLKSYDRKSLAKIIAYVPQTIKLDSDFIVKDYLTMGRTPYKRFGESMAALDYRIVEKYAEELGIMDTLEKEFCILSGGQKQMVAIGRALIQETPIIVLDEPMSALDIGKQADFLSLLKKLKNKNGKSIVLTSHNPAHALAISDECSVCFINERKIVKYGNCKDVLTTQMMEEVYGNKVWIDDKNGMHFII